MRAANAEFGTNKIGVWGLRPQLGPRGRASSLLPFLSPTHITAPMLPILNAAASPAGAAVVERALFIGRADRVFVGNEAGTQRLSRNHKGDGGPPILVVMGVSGAGKTSVAQELAARLGWAFEEGDSLHPAANVAKMHAGIELTDADREPWLARVDAWIDRQLAAGQPGIITCSALKRAYRNIVIGDRPLVRLVYLRGSPALISNRLAQRHGHFMPPSLLQSQFDSLEEPGPDEDPLTVDIGPSLGEIVETIIRMLGCAIGPGTNATGARK